MIVIVTTPTVYKALPSRQRYSNQLPSQGARAGFHLLLGASVLRIILRLHEVLLYPAGKRKLRDVVASDDLQDDEPARVLERLDPRKAWQGVQQLDGRGRVSCAERSQEVEELAVARVLHRAVDEVDDRRHAVRLWLWVETELTWKWKFCKELEIRVFSQNRFFDK